LGVAVALPELTTSLIAVFKKKKAISAGILIGSNVTNPMFALGLGALISTYTVPHVIILFDLPFKIFTALLILYFLWKHEILKKKNAIVLICIYLIYIYIRSLWFPIDF
jgi:cation:H+ antiporter